MYNIESSFICDREGKEDFVHDTIGSFFASSKAREKLENGTLDFAELHRMMGFRGKGSVESRYRKVYSFLREMFGDGYNPPVLDAIIADKGISKLARVRDRYGLGHDSKLIIRIKDDSYCNYKGQLAIANLVEHIRAKHDVSLVCVEGSEGEVDVAWFRAFPDSEIRREVAMYFMKKGEITGMEFLAINTKYDFTIFGSENRDEWIKEHEENMKDGASSSETHMQRAATLVRKTIKAMETYNKNVAMLIYGGGIAYDVNISPMIEKGVSFVLLDPHEKGMNWELWRKVLRNERTSLEDIIMDGFHGESQEPEDEQDSEEEKGS